jgi:hypothetical protein
MCLGLALIAGCAGDRPPEPPQPMHGWQRLAAAPPECTLQVTRDPAELPALDWQACPFAAGCRWAGAPWADDAGWGFGGLLSAAERDGRLYMSWSRALGEGVWETVMTADDWPIAAWRQRQGEPCLIGGPWLTPGGDASLVVLRRDSEQAPWVLHASPERLARHPSVARFGAAGAAVRPRDISAASAGHLVLWEQSGRFAIRDLLAGTTIRPGTGAGESAPDRWMRPTAPGPHGVLYQDETGGVGSVRRIAADGRDVLVAGGGGSFDGAVSDGLDAAWTRTVAPGAGLVVVELWTAATDRLDAPIRVTTLPSSTPPLLSIGGGWIAARFDAHDVRLWRIADGADQTGACRLPVAPDLDWDGGPHGLVLAGGRAWVKASPVGRPGNDVRHLVRFDLEALPRTVALPGS